MRIKTLFSIPDGEKVTEKALRRVLISTISSILLCMTCLVSTTWAWFAVSIENTGNVINIGKPEINLTVDGSSYESGSPLPSDDYILSIVHANEVDDFQKKSTLYVTLNIQNDGGTTTVFTTLNEGNNYSATINIENSTEKPCSFSWTVSWFAPVNAVALTDNTIILTAEEPTESPAQATTQAATEASTEASTEATTDTVSTEPSSEPANEATEPETTASTEETTDTTVGES